MITTINITLIVLAIVLAIVGIVGCILPVIPGPPISFVGLLLVYFVTNCQITIPWLIVLGIFMIVVTVLDFIIPSWTTKKFGGTKWGSRGCAIGLLVSLFGFQWWAIFLAPFLGAFIGEVLYLRKQKESYEENSKKVWKASFGAFMGMMFGIVGKLVYSCFVFFLIIKEIIIAICA